MAIQKKTKKPVQVSFNKAHLAKVIDTLRMELSIREKPDKARTLYMHLAVKSDVKKFTDEEKWLLNKIIKAFSRDAFNPKIVEPPKIDDDPDIFA